MDAQDYKNAAAIVATLNDQEKAKVETALTILACAGVRLADRIADESTGARAPKESELVMRCAKFFESLSYKAMRDEDEAEAGR